MQTPAPRSVKALAPPALALACWLCTTSGLAALGGQVQDLASETQILGARSQTARAAATTSAGALFTRHDVSLADGGTATQFAAADGTVFAVAWQAPTMPDLATLLDRYKASLDRSQQSRQSGQSGPRTPRRFDASDGDWVLSSQGHLRAFRGYAYLRAQLPAGFDLKVLTP